MELQTNFNFHKVIYGFSGRAINKDYVGMAFQLSDRMWKIVKGKGLKNEGKNVWVYESDHLVFAGVELIPPISNETGLEVKEISLKKYAYYKHVGPYHLIKQAGQQMNQTLEQMGEKSALPYIEIYGHWTPYENLQETELIVSLPPTHL